MPKTKGEFYDLETDWKKSRSSTLAERYIDPGINRISIFVQYSAVLQVLDSGQEK